MDTNEFSLQLGVCVLTRSTVATTIFVSQSYPNAVIDVHLLSIELLSYSILVCNALIDRLTDVIRSIHDMLGLVRAEQVVEQVLKRVICHDKRELYLSI